jgi:hypothetical protein
MKRYRDRNGWAIHSRESRRCARRTAEEATQSRIAERTVISVLPARVTRGPQHQASELSWGCRRAARPAGGFCMEGALSAAACGDPDRAAQQYARRTAPGRISVDDTVAARGAAMLRRVGLPNVPSAECCPLVSRVALRCGPQNCRGAVGGQHARLADSAWIVRWARQSGSAMSCHRPCRGAMFRGQRRLGRSIVGHATGDRQRRNRSLPTTSGFEPYTEKARIISSKAIQGKFNSSPRLAEADLPAASPFRNSWGEPLLLAAALRLGRHAAWLVR